MRIKAEDLHTHIGEVIKTKDNGDIPNGTYLIMESDGEREMIYDIQKNHILNASFGDKDEVILIYTPADERLELAYEGYVKLLFLLMSKDWQYIESIDDPAYLINNIYPTVNKIKILKLLKHGKFEDLDNMELDNG